MVWLSQFQPQWKAHEWKTTQTLNLAAALTPWREAKADLVFLEGIVPVGFCRHIDMAQRCHLQDRVFIESSFLLAALSLPPNYFSTEFDFQCHTNSPFQSQNIAESSQQTSQRIFQEISRAILLAQTSPGGLQLGRWPRMWVWGTGRCT